MDDSTKCVSQLPAYVLSGMREQHLWYLRQCIGLAKLSPPDCRGQKVGSILLRRRSILNRALQDPLFKPPMPNEEYPATALLRPGRTISSSAFEDVIISTGFTHQPPFETASAVACCIENARREYQESPELSDHGDAENVLYVSLEPFAEQSGEQLSCAQMIVQTHRSAKVQGKVSIDRVYYGVNWPQEVTGQTTGREVVTAGGVECEHITGLENEILDVALTDRDSTTAIPRQDRSDQDNDDTSAQPRNPHKRMWEEPLD